MNELVQRLAAGNHPVEASLRPERSAAALKASIDRGYVHIKFTATQGGTDLGMRFDPAASDLSQGDFVQSTGTVHLVGYLTLNADYVKCVADIDLSTLTGQGHLEPLESPIHA